jgi:hypothetical protein
MSDELDDEVGENETVSESVPPELHDQISLDSVADAKREYARIYNAYWNHGIVRDRAKTCGYLLSQMLALFRLEIDAELLKRIEALEERINKK